MSRHLRPDPNPGDEMVRIVVYAAAIVLLVAIGLAFLNGPNII